MLPFILNEDNQPLPLPVIFSRKIKDKISAIKAYNQGKSNALSQWYQYLNDIVSYIEKRSIAFNYSGISSLLPNRTNYNNDMGYGIGYKIMINENDCAFVYIFMVNLNPESFGLKVPPTLKENKSIRLTESQLRKIIRETLLKALYD